MPNMQEQAQTSTRLSAAAAAASHAAWRCIKRRIDAADDDQDGDDDDDDDEDDDDEVPVCQLPKHNESYLAATATATPTATATDPAESAEIMLISWRWGCQRTVLVTKVMDANANRILERCKRRHIKQRIE